MKKIALIIHGHRSQSKTTIETIHLLENEDSFKIVKFLTKSIGHAIEIAKMACANNDVVVAVGGDGTCNEVVNGIMKSKIQGISFGIIPNGTGNDFIRTLDGFNPEKFFENLQKGTGRKIDLGQVSFKGSERYFLNVADIGFGAKVVETMSRQRKKGLGGKTSYSLAILWTFFSYKKTKMSLLGDGISFKGKSLMLVFSNGTTFGHGLQIFPDAKIDNGVLGLTIIGDVSLYEYVKNLTNLKKGRKVIHPEVHYHEFKKLKITTQKSVFIETDGEIAGNFPLYIQVIPGALTLVN